MALIILICKDVESPLTNLRYLLEIIDLQDW